MKINILISTILLFLSSTILASGVDSISNILLKVNSKFNERNFGKITYIHKIKPIMSNKTYAHEINLSFDKRIGKDTLSPFVMLTNYYPMKRDTYHIVMGFNSMIYEIDTVNKSITINKSDTINNKNYKDLVSNFSFRLFKPFISKSKTSFKPKLDYYQFHKLSITNYNKIPSYEIILCTLDTLNPNYGYDSLKIYISTSDYSLLKYENAVYDSTYSNFQRTEFDSIMYDTTSLNIVHYLDNYINKRYALIEVDPYRQESIETIVKEGDIVPNWIAFDRNKKEIKLKNINSKLILFDFSYLACQSCLKSIAMLNMLRDKYSIDDLEICWINPFDYDKRAFMFEQLEKRNAKFPIYFDINKEIIKQYGITVYPYTFLVEASSLRLIKTFIGYTPEHETEIINVINNEIKK